MSAADQSTSFSTDGENPALTAESTTGSNDSPSVGGSQELLIFRCFVVVMGFVGCLMNGFVLRVLMSKRLRSQPSNILIINQVLLDLLSSASLIACYAVKIPTLYLDGRWGFLLCLILTSDSSVFAFQAGSIVNLVLIAVERYLKIVHMIFHRTHFRKWMAFVGIGFAWASGILVNMELIWTAAVIDGQCFAYYTWSGDQSSLAYGLFVNIWEFVVPLGFFIYCYSRILFVVRKRSQVHAENYTNQDMAASLQTGAHRSQLNVITTMLIISVAFVVCWFPNVVWYFLTLINYKIQNSDTVYYASLFLIFLNVSLNPFIYAVKHNAVKKRLRDCCCLGRSQQTQEPISFTIPRTEHA